MSIYQRILQLCKEKGTTKTEVEKECGFSQNSLLKWEHSYPAVDRVIKVADYFGVSLDYLVGRNAQTDLAKQTTTAISTELAELSTDRDFVNSAKLYKVVDNECKKQICAYILGVATALGVNIAQILGK